MIASFQYGFSDSCLLVFTAFSSIPGVVSVDVAAAHMLSEASRHWAEQVDLRIDHHGSDTPFAPLELVDAGAGACGEIIWDLLQELEVPLDKAIADALYIAVSTDTGGFRYANTTAHTFQTAAACAVAGGDIHGINQRVFDTNSFAKLRLQGWMVENIRFRKEGTLAICPLPREVERQLGVTEDDMDSISGFPRSIEGVRMAATLRELPEGKIKVSVRALPGHDAAKVCAKFGGGGHKGAAGAAFKMPLAEAVKAVEKAMLEL